MQHPLRPPIQDIYDRQVARCLGDIEKVFDLPSLVEDRIKKAIEFTCKDVDRRNRKERENRDGISGNH